MPIAPSNSQWHPNANSFRWAVQTLASSSSEVSLHQDPLDTTPNDSRIQCRECGQSSRGHLGNPRCNLCERIRLQIVAEWANADSRNTSAWDGGVLAPTPMGPRREPSTPLYLTQESEAPSRDEAQPSVMESHCVGPFQLRTEQRRRVYWLMQAAHRRERVAREERDQRRARLALAGLVVPVASVYVRDPSASDSGLSLPDDRRQEEDDRRQEEEDRRQEEEVSQRIEDCRRLEEEELEELEYIRSSCRHVISYESDNET